MSTFTPKSRRSLLSSPAFVQAPFIKVTIGEQSFGVYERSGHGEKRKDGSYSAYNVRYPQFIKSLHITKINGQVNQYTLNLVYPVRENDDPNYFEKVLSQAGSTKYGRKIIFSYGDSAMPNYVYKDEEAIITGVTTSFNFESSSISYTIKATSTGLLGKIGARTFPRRKIIPSEEIKKLFLGSQSLQEIFRGMPPDMFSLSNFIDSDDVEVEVETKINISELDYILYLVSCMKSKSSDKDNSSGELYTLVIHDDTSYENVNYNSYTNVLGEVISGPYFTVRKVTTQNSHSEAYSIDVGYNTSTLVSSFVINNNENYSIYYDYANDFAPVKYVRTIGSDGHLQDEYRPAVTSENILFTPTQEDINWWSKVTKYPISGTITIRGLLRPALLMQYIRVNIIFPGGTNGQPSEEVKDTYGTRQHIYSGLYLITQQNDSISESGYSTTLSITKIDS